MSGVSSLLLDSAKVRSIAVDLALTRRLVIIPTRAITAIQLARQCRKLLRDPIEWTQCLDYSLNLAAETTTCTREVSNARQLAIYVLCAQTPPKRD